MKRVKRDRASGALAAIISTPDRYAALEVSRFMVWGVGPLYHKR